MTWRMIQNCKRNWLVSSKLTWGIWQILIRALTNLKNLHFNGLLLNKAYNVWAKRKCIGVLLHDTEYWCNIWRKTDLCFQKWPEEFSKFSPELMFKSIKIGTLMRSFYSKKKMYELKTYRGVLCQYIEKWCKIWRKIDLSVQNWHQEFDECWLEQSKISKICPLMGFFLTT